MVENQVQDTIFGRNLIIDKIGNKWVGRSPKYPTFRGFSYANLEVDVIRSLSVQLEEHIYKLMWGKDKYEQHN